jgi:hypothetical protein
MFLLEDLETSFERKCDLEVVVVMVVSTGPRVVEGSFHLADRGYHILGLLDHPFLLGRDLTNLIV